MQNNFIIIIFLTLFRFYNASFYMKRARLIIEHEYEFEVLGLVSSVKEYKLAWFINKKLDINMVKQEDISFHFTKKDQIVISNYLYKIEHSSFLLLKNRSYPIDNLIPDKNPWLLPEVWQYDYIIRLKGNINSMSVDNILNEIKSLPIVQYICKLNIESLRSKENLIF